MNIGACISRAQVEPHYFPLDFPVFAFNMLFRKIMRALYFYVNTTCYLYNKLAHAWTVEITEYFPAHYENILYKSYK